MLVGYARISTLGQNSFLQTDTLREVCYDKLFVEAASGKRLDPSQFTSAPKYVRPEDTLVVWKCSRLPAHYGCSL